MWEFVRYVLTDLHSQIRGLIFLASIFYYNYFIENSHLRKLLPISLIYESPHEYHVSIISEEYTRCD